ncbi:MAG: TatD family hydrolase [Actinomycetota bacterium]|nr:TatD family hydrolase [Actinomycetota bacterium]
MFVDAHVHIDRYPRPPEVLEDASTAHVVCVAVTETPRDFEMLSLRAGKRPGLCVALGAHPLRASSLTSEELKRFTTLLAGVDYVGEVGLDGSREGRATLRVQRRVFEQVLASPGITERVLTVHSRGAEPETIEALEQAGATAVLHWYSGALKHAEVALQAGLYFSINAAMLRSQKAAKLFAALPRDRVLTETDGPYAKIGGRASVPADVPRIVADLAGVWSCTAEEAREQIWANMTALHARAKGRLSGGRSQDRLFDRVG